MDTVTVGELTRCLSRIEAKLDKALEDYEQRLRKVERALYVAAGLSLTGIGTGLTAVLGGGL